MSKTSRRAAFYARRKVARRIAALALSRGNGWVHSQALVWGVCGFIGPDLQPWLDFHWGRCDDLPQTPLGAMVYL